MTLETGLSGLTSENNDFEFDLFQAALNEAIQRHAPLKQRHVQVPFI